MDQFKSFAAASQVTLQPRLTSANVFMQTAHRKRRGSESESFRLEPGAPGQTISTGVPGEGSKPPDARSAERLLLHCSLVNRFLFSLCSHTAEICFSFAPRKIIYPIYFKSAQCRVPARPSAVSRSGEITKCALLRTLLCPT